MKRLTAICTASLWLLLSVGCACMAASFSADIYSGPKSMAKTGKVYSNGKMIRMEMKAGEHLQIMIVRLDKKKIWMLNPGSKEYTEMPVTKPELADPRSEAMLMRNATKKELGTETVSGYSCRKTAYVTKSGPKGMATRWYSQKLDWPVKTHVQMPDGRTFTQELRNIKLGNQASSLFEIPKGYKVVAVPTRPPPAKPGGPKK